MMMNEAIATAFPLVIAPVEGEMTKSESWGTRYIASRNKMLREISLPWLRARFAVGNFDIPLPYGLLDENFEFLCGQVPKSLFAEFLDHAKAAFPKECAGAFVWNSVSGAWAYKVRTPISASNADIHYMEVHLEDDEHLVVDVHSHGAYEAFFSRKDDLDDAGAMRISLVLGSVNSKVTSDVRLCLAGKFFKISIDSDGIIRGPNA